MWFLAATSFICCTSLKMLLLRATLVEGILKVRLSLCSAPKTLPISSMVVLNPRLTRDRILIIIYSWSIFYKSKWSYTNSASTRTSQTGSKDCLLLKTTFKITPSSLYVKNLSLFWRRGKNLNNKKEVNIFREQHTLNLAHCSLIKMKNSLVTHAFST